MWSKVWYESLWYGDRDFATGKMLWPKAEPIQPAEIVGPPSEPHKQVVVNRSAIGPVQETLRIQTPLRARTGGRKHQAPFTSVSFNRRRVGLIPERRSISVGEKTEILERQANKCIYCARKFGSTVWDMNGKTVALSIRFDHFEPYALRQNETSENLVAACGVCNALKSDLVFDSLKATRLWLAREWERRGFQESFPGMQQFKIDLSLVDNGGWTGSGSHLQTVSFARKPMFEARIGGKSV